VWNANVGRLLPVVLAAAGLALAGGVTEAGPSAAAAPLKLEVAWAASPALPQTPQVDAARLKQALDAARRRDVGQALSLAALLADPVARKIVDWALVDIMADQMTAAELQAAIDRLAAWPRADARQKALARAQSTRPPGPIPYAALTDRQAAADPQDAAGEVYRSRRLQMNDALRRGAAREAYAAISQHGQPAGSVAYAEAEADAGWLALDKLHDPALAEQHFARLDAAVKSPVSKARAAYWRGRAAEALGDRARAQTFYEQGAVYSTTFYGQLAAQKAGRREVVLAPDPVPTARDRSSFDGAELTRALRLLAAARERGLIRVFALHYGGQVQSQAELALLVDELKAMDEQEAALLAYRRGAQQGFILHERGYPLVTPPAVPGGAETALVLAVIRQESQFDPRVRSSADARGMMQLLPSRGRLVAREMGINWSEDLLWDARTNMRLGSWYLGQLAQDFNGSYVLAAAAYNAGRNRPPEWIQVCGDPRSPASDPLDFIECIPFSETRDYVMNVMANYQIYQARLNGGRAPLRAEANLRAVRQGSQPSARVEALKPERTAPGSNATFSTD
jgi:soluble lytic murein transglycosylase